MPEFATLIPEARKFYGALAQNNRKDWWTENRAPYDETLKPISLALIAQIETRLGSLTGLPVKGKLFRPHRDVRFSKDKTPYKTHLHMLWTVKTQGPQDVAFFFGIGLDYISAGGGIMNFEKPVLEDWRLFADQDHKRLLKITTKLRDAGFQFREPALKRVPSGYDKDHPAAELLRMKGCVASTDIETTQDLSLELMDKFKTLWPLNQLLIQIVEA